LAVESRKLAIYKKDERKLQWTTIVAIGMIHVVALLAFREDLFTYSGLAVAFFMYVLTGMFGITICYHRLLTHRSFRTYKWMEYFLTFCACQALQSGPIEWTAMHRIHHKEADEEPDPHSPLVNFLWAHAGWLFYDMPGAHTYKQYSRFAKDLARDPVQRFLNKNFYMIYIATALIIYAAGELYAGIGLSWLIWGVFARTVFLWHATWLVNSATHLWGYRNYNTDEDSTNNWWVALISFGEGWHNNHHADQRSAAHGQRWFEFDISYVVIKCMEKLGLAWDVVSPSKRVVAKRIDIMVDDEALKIADERRKDAMLESTSQLSTQTDPTIPVEVKQMSSISEAFDALISAASRANEHARNAFMKADSFEKREDITVDLKESEEKQIFEKAKDFAFSSVEQAKYAYAESLEFASQVKAFCLDASHDSQEELKNFEKRGQFITEHTYNALVRITDEVTRIFQGIGRPVITSSV
tara:strand:+ start:41385 stop:42794 length:1410 start_codon:yes stop_codon:yes gene_type:complete